MKFQSKLGLLMKGIFLIFIAIAFEIVGIIITLPEGTAGIIALVCLTIFFSGWLAFAGIWSIRGYRKSANCLKNALKIRGDDSVKRSRKLLRFFGIIEKSQF